MSVDHVFLIGWIGAALAAGLVFTLIVLAALLARSGPIRLRHWVEEAGGRLRALYGRPARFESYRLLLNLAAGLGPLVLLALLARVSARQGLGSPMVFGLVLTALLVLAAEFLARTSLARDREGALRRLTGLYRLSLAASTPFLSLLTPLLRRSLDGSGSAEEEDEASEEEIEAFIDVGTQEGILEPREEDLIQRVIDFGDASVRSVMTPRIDIVCAAVDMAKDELRALFLESKHSRLPVYRDSVDSIIGVLHIRDFFSVYGSGEEFSLVDLISKPHFVPETKSLHQLLSELQVLHQQVAVVVDEYGGTAGLVTIEDLLEEIVGEIVDEHETDEKPLAEPLGDSRWRFDGRAHLELVEEAFDAELDDLPYETVGGLIFGHLGYVPEIGALVETRGLRLLVEKVEARRIESVVVSSAEGEDDESDS